MTPNQLLARALLVKDVMDLHLEHQTDRDEELTPDGIPSSWLDEQGVRHAVVFDQTLPHYMRIKQVGSDWVLIEKAPF